MMVEKMMCLGGGQARASRHPARWRPSPGLPAPCPVEAKPGPPGTLPGGGQARASRHPARWRPSPGLPAPCPVEVKPGPPGTLPGGGQARASRHPALGTWLWWRPSPGLPAPCPWYLALVEAKPGPPGTLPLVPGFGGGQARASRHPALGTWLGGV